MWLLCVDECIRYKLAGKIANKTRPEYLECLNATWIRCFGPTDTFATDQEGAITTDLAGTTFDRYSKRELAGADPVGGEHTRTGLIESHTRMTKSIALKNKVDAKKGNVEISDETLIYESVMAQNLMLNKGGNSSANALSGFTPKDFYDLGNQHSSAAKSA